jgi:hypothetical protein
MRGTFPLIQTSAAPRKSVSRYCSFQRPGERQLMPVFRQVLDLIFSEMDTGSCACFLLIKFDLI